MRRHHILPDGEYSDSDESASAEETSKHNGDGECMQLQEDIFGHVVITFLRRGTTWDDKVRGVILLSFVVMGQVLVSGALFAHCMHTLLQVEEDIAVAVLRHHESDIDVGGARAALERLCGSSVMEHEPLSDGLGTAFHQHRRWRAIEAPESRIEMLRYQLRLHFLTVFACTAVFWTWRCFLELRAGWTEICSFLFYEHIVEPGAMGQSLSSESESAPTEQEIHLITRKGQVVAVLVMSTRLIVAGMLLSCGYLLLCMSEKVIDLILNAVALEFIFEIDDLIVKAMLAKKEYRMLGQWRFATPVGLLKVVSKRVGCVNARFSDKVRRPCGGWRARDWLRISCLCFIVFLFVWPHYVKVRGLHSRAKAVCLTGGLTDGTSELSEEMPDDFVVFPVADFCLKFVASLATDIPEPVCGAWRLSPDSGWDLGLCSNTGDLEQAMWNPLSSLEREIRQVCLDMWFGRGLPPGAPVPALARRRSEPQPVMFGCRKADLRFSSVRSVRWPFFHGGGERIVFLRCKRPAFGPASAAWNATPLDSARYISPSNFFRYDPRSPIERQVGACDALRGSRACGGDPCLIVAHNGHGRSCDDICRDRGNLVCAEAFDTGGRCPGTGVGAKPCGEAFPKHAVPVCRCQLPPEKRVCGLLPDARARCDHDPCKVLVAPVDATSGRRTSYKNCLEYCRSAGLACVHQSAVMSHSCDVDDSFSLTCLDELPKHTPISRRKSRVGVSASKVLEGFVDDIHSNRVCSCKQE